MAIKSSSTSCCFIRLARRLFLVVICHLAMCGFSWGASPELCTEAAKAPPQHQSAVKPPPSSEVVFLTLSGNHWDEWSRMKNSRHRGKYSPENTPRKRLAIPQKISIVRVVNDKGLSTGKYVMPVYAGDLIIDSLKRQLSEAGYTVKVVPKLPANAQKGFVISLVSTQMLQTPGLLSLEGSCDLRIRLDRWRKGIKVGSREYASTISGSSFTEQDLLLRELLSKAACDITSKTLIDVISHWSAESQGAGAPVPCFTADSNSNSRSVALMLGPRTISRENTQNNAQF